VRLALVKVVRLTPESFSKVVKETVKVLLSCGVVVTPTDTCYGLMADIRNVRAVEKIYEIKKRPRNKPLPILVSSVEMAGKYGELDEVALELIRKFMPGPLTVVVKKKEAVPDIVNPINAALRIPNNKFVLAVVEGLGGAVTGTSANRSGDKPPYTVEDVK